MHMLNVRNIDMFSIQSEIVEVLLLGSQYNTGAAISLNETVGERRTFRSFHQSHLNKLL